ncbi:pyridoxal phosphate-dependent aminotransferase [Roseisolibacter agri]|uniref:Aminotransferase n=1 Tax=Roseisolibacter agri TaxID=2014610 RepID=A0AA37VEN3_9BACT|nr:aminotransferase class I/II-fold pyridoxal phosphate-dependent enzyme [Roseisolibacter agri]GLC25469.1 aminotransferase [Roseisolibacter agri]
MPLSRRSFVRSLGLSGAGVVSASLIGGRGREALAAELRRAGSLDSADHAGLALPDVIKLSSNENPRGPSEVALRALREALAGSSRYPFAQATALREAIAKANGVPVDHVLLGCGSSEVLRVAVDTFTSPAKALVTAAPTFEDAADRARVLGAPVRAIPVLGDLRLDLPTMAAQAGGAGLVFVCNPNNPTGTLYPATAIAVFVRRVKRDAPDAAVLIDEAYHEYVDDPAYATALPLALETPGVLVVRTFSKAHGMAGLRVGYAMARPETIRAMARHSLGINVNALGATAALASLGDRELAARERRLNGEAREYTTRFFASRGYRVTPSQANFVMVDVRRDPKAFQDACRAQQILVGRPFPPLATHARVSIGTMDEMRAATEVFARVLGKAAT